MAPHHLQPYAELVRTTDSTKRAELEAKLETTQAAEVDEFIEKTCWGDDVPEFLGRLGTAEERRAALAAAFDKQGAFLERDEGPEP